jgi:hypothetical protein
MSTTNGEPRTRARDLGWSGVLLALPLLAAFPIFTVWGVLLFVADAGSGPVRAWSELLIWQAPLAIWLITVVAVVVLAARRRRALPVAGIGVGLVALSWAVGLILPLVTG